ncbi:MAG TPA: YceI family protein [Acidimicrobiia bacterium]|nr:YceI family protein [Acidimicrobiia bacterium]
MTTGTVKETHTPSVGTWVIDRAHSDLKIIARHLMVTKVRGTFDELSGTIVVAEDPTQSTVEVVAKAATVMTGTADRDNHLRSPDFLDAENHPEIVFKSTKLTPKNDRWILSGDLTVRGVTRPVTFALTFDGEAVDPFGNTKAAFTAVGEVDREQWGLTWNVPLEGGGVLVSKTLRVEFDVQAVLQS